MQIKQAEFITSIADYAKYPTEGLDEITFVGRSNVGKSSLINFLTGRKNLARTSSMPGRTRLINIFAINKDFWLVDLPGYGFQAGGSKTDAQKWGKLIEGYLQYNMRLRHAFLLLDIRHAPSEQDRHMLSYLNYLRIPFSVIATKCDQVPKSKLKPQLRMLDSYCGVGVDNIIPVSTLAKTGKEQVLAKIDEVLATARETAQDATDVAL